MRDLPDDLAVIPDSALAEQRAMRDDKLAPPFQRWPDLSRFEFVRLRRLYAERLKIVRYLGRTSGA
jgi:hypothetical protein